MENELFKNGTANSGMGEGPLPLEQIVRGEVLRVVFASEDGDYVVIRLKDEAGQEQTLVGAFGTILEGQDIEAWGRWEKHKDHGRQFRAQRFRAVLPTSEMGIRRFLASGLIPGIGKVYAERIVDHFHEQTLDVLNHYSARLNEVDGIGKKRIGQIRSAWQELAEKRDIFVYLQSLGIGNAYCNRIYGIYGVAAPELVRSNPYRLATEIAGIGFLTADKIAQALGIVKDNPLRLQAGAVYVLRQLADQQGHVCYPKDLLLAEAGRILDVTPELARQGLDRALLDGSAIADPAAAADSETFIYTREYYHAETELADSLRTLISAAAAGAGEIPDFRGPRYDLLNAEQRQAVHTAFRSRLSIITGGPGVGKTTVVGVIVGEARRHGCSVLLASPTGRAAKRLSESCHQEGKTIHRLLKWDPAKGTFQHHRKNPLRADFLIVDEVSMLDLELANHLFRAVTPQTHVLLVGDRDQLPSVGPGAILHDLIDCGRIPVTQLIQIYRQEENSRIVLNAHAVNHGTMPDLRPLPAGMLGDFYWIEQDDPERAIQTIARMVAERIPQTFKFDPLADVQVLAPMNKGSCGSHALNDLLQRTLNPGPKPEFRLGERLFRTGDRVMQVANNYDKGIFNGEMGQIVAVDATAKTFKISFDIGIVDYAWHEAEQIRLAYAVTVHKSQGCEFPVVIMPLLSQHYVMLQRNLVYTGMTRSRRLLIMIGTRRALAIAIRNDRPALRYTRLGERLKNLN